MINVRPSYKYTFDVNNNFISSSSYDIYYIPDYINMEVIVRYQDTKNKTSEKTKRNKTEKEDWIYE